MSNPPEDDYTPVTIYFRGKNHTAAAEQYIIQFSDGGMAEDIEERLALHDHYVTDSDFDLDGRGITIVLGDKPAD